MVLGSVEIFGDDWLDKEENAKLCDVLFSWLLNETDLDMTSDRQVGRSTTLSAFVVIFIVTDRYDMGSVVYSLSLFLFFIRSSMSFI